MIALYIVAIVVVCGLVVFYFCWVTRKRKKTLERMGDKKPKKVKQHKKTVVKEELKKSNLNLSVTGSGIVVSQDPIQGTSVEEGTIIKVTMGN